jgi:hypothetical protein
LQGVGSGHLASRSDWGHLARRCGRMDRCNLPHPQLCAPRAPG